MHGLALLVAALCVVANAFFVAAEFAFAKVRPTALEAMARAGDARAARAVRMSKHLFAYLSAAQLGITLASLGLGWIGEPALAEMLAPPLTALGASDGLVHGVSYAVAFAGISILHIVVGEQVPKTLAIQRPEAVARWTGLPLRVFSLVTWPFMWSLNGLSNVILRAIGFPSVAHAEGKLSAEEMRLIIQASFGDAAAMDRKRDLLERVLRGTDRAVRSVMVPRVDMTVLSDEDDADGALALVRHHGYSRYPVCEGGDPDRVLGYVHVKDVFTAPLHESLSAVKRDVLFVPETTTVGDLLSEFQLTSIPLAIVVDEYGGTSGLVTVEDVVEEMVGEIQDEHDLELPKVTRRDDGSVVVAGAVPLGEIQLEGLDLEADDVADTVGGFVVAKLGRLARPGDRVVAGEWEIVVQDVRRRRVFRVAMIPLSRRSARERPPS